jgi:hypothetical protein
MPANPLILGATQKRDLASLKAKATADPVDMAEVMRLVETPAGHERHHRRMRSLTIEIPVDFAVTYTIERGHPIGVPCQHLSMSSHRHGRAPTPAAVWMICEELGFRGGLEECRVWTEDIGGRDIAINVVQPLAQ